MRSWFSHGKVLLCGEYSVMNGIEALAFPVNTGQWLSEWEVPTTGISKVIWQGIDSSGKAWIDARIDTDIMHLVESTNEDVAATLLKLLQEIKIQKPLFFEHKTIRIETRCEFSLQHGLGSSSTLIALVANWTGIDAFLLQKAIFGGSGYDVAVASTGKPAVYWLENQQPNWQPFSLNAELTSNWFLAFPGHKQNSRTALHGVKDRLAAMAEDKLYQQQLTTCINAIKTATTVPLLEAMLELWQALLAQYLEIPKAYDDLQIAAIPGGLCKWLGAWGGDVLLVNEKIAKHYASVFENMEVVKWNESVMNS